MSCCTDPSTEEEALSGMAVLETVLWNAVPKFLRNLDQSLQAIGCKALPAYFTNTRFGSWMGGDRDGNPNVTAEVTRRVVHLQRYIAAEMFSKEIDLLLFELSIYPATEKLKQEANMATKRRTCE